MNKEYGNAGTADVVVEQLSANSYIIGYDYRLLPKGLATMIMGLGHEIAGHLTIPEHEKRGMSFSPWSTDSGSSPPQVGSGLLTLIPAGRLGPLLMAPMPTLPCRPPP